MRPTPLLLFLAAFGIAGFVAPASAAVVYETDFATKSDGNPYNAGNLQFQDGWLGQDFAQVDPSGAGSAGVPSNTFFTRNLNNRGALGNTAGGGGAGETSGPGFSVGDKIRVTGEYSFTLPGRVNAELAQIGVDDAFASGGFNPAPVIGAEMFYSEFQSSTGGSFKLFGNFARNGFSGADNAFAMFASGLEIGLDPDGVAGPADLESDLLEVSIEMTYLGADQWQTSDLTLVNATTATTLADAAVDNPTILTEVQTVPSSNDLFGSILWSRTAITDSSFSSFRYEFTAVPEPSSLAMLSLVALSLAARSRR